MINNNTKKERLDLLLVERGFFDSRERAKIAIMEGLIYVNNQKEDKAGCLIHRDSVIEFRGKDIPYVSRAGFKLEKAIKSFNIDLKDKICIDIGSSTGGFTDCMLQNGAKKVYAIDCGTNQLAYKLRVDDRVELHENLNARYLNRDIICDDISFMTMDVSFISITKLMEPVGSILNDTVKAVLLIKPQFEVGRENVGNGVIRDKNLQIDVIKKIINLCKELNYSILGLDYSPIKGAKGNIEYLLYITREKKDDIDIDSAAKNVVDLSHNELGEK